MKKKSRFLTGLLSAVMALSLCAMPAAADDVESESYDCKPCVDPGHRQYYDS